jgi:polysaccharide deacetylase 2 family uncharacterized protein YibQ
MTRQPRNHGTFAVRQALPLVAGLLALAAAAAPAYAASGHTAAIDLPAIGIIIDDIGNLEHRDKQAIQLPGAITYAFLPHTPHAHDLALLAHSYNKEVMLHLPMESVQHKRLGPGGITLDMTYQEFARQLQSDLASVPHAVGVNNHMGSLLTQHPGHMVWLMRELNKRENLYFVDSYTTVHSVAEKIADENLVPNLRRDVFLDSDQDPKQIRYQFRRLLKLARKHGTALAIGHPYPETIAVLKQLLPTLDAQGVRLLPVSKLLKLHQQRIQTWRASLSH